MLRNRNLVIYFFRWCYRAPKPPPAPGNPDFKFFIAAELAGGFMWWWILYHCYHDLGHLIVSPFVSNNFSKLQFLHKKQFFKVSQKEKNEKEKNIVKK